MFTHRSFSLWLQWTCFHLSTNFNENSFSLYCLHPVEFAIFAINVEHVSVFHVSYLHYHEAQKKVTLVIVVRFDFFVFKIKDEKKRTQYTHTHRPFRSDQIAWANIMVFRLRVILINNEHRFSTKQWME